MDAETERYQEVSVQVLSDLSAELPRMIKVNDRFSSMTAAPGSKRVIFEARGELFNVLVKDGYTLNLTRSSGAFDQQPAWSPDGKHLAYWSDRSGENEIWLQPMDSEEEPRQLSKRNKGFGYRLYWSPQSDKLAFIDEKNDISIIDIVSGETAIAGNTNWNQGHGSRFGYPISWAPDGSWIAFSAGLDNSNNAIFLYHLGTKKLSQATSGFYNDYYPYFGKDGKYLFYLTDREFSSVYSDMDETWVYPNSTKIVSVGLTKAQVSLLEPLNDALSLEDKKKDTPKDTTKQPLQIDLEGFEARLVLLPPAAGNIGGIMPFEGKLVYLRLSKSGSGERNSTLMVYDFKSREEKPVMDKVRTGVVSADGKSILVQSGNRYGIIKPAPGQKISDAIPTDGLSMDLVPKEEWTQIFNDTWRRHRDFFYDPDMHGLDWEALRDRYGALLKDARTRWDVSNLQSNLAAELSAGHTYTRGGDNEANTPSRPTGFLGINWAKSYGKYQIGHIVKPADWDTEVRSPFDQPGVDVQAGDFIHSVNGISLDMNKEPYAAFEGLSGKTVSLKISRIGEADDAQEVIVKLLSNGQESALRLSEWIEQNRKKVETLSDGKLGYINMANTSGLGQLQLVRMFYGQLDKQGFIIDERFNGGVP